MPIIALDKKEASAKARRIGDVKRNHIDWCLNEPKEITKEAFDKLQEQLVKDPYWNRKTRQNTALFADRLVCEPNYTNHRGVKTNTVTFSKPTSSEIKSYRWRRSKIKLSDIDEYIEEDEEN